MIEDARIGTELGGYRIERVIGRGGMSSVYLAEHIRLGRMVALKLLSPELAGSERFRDRFLRESKLAASIDHPNIVPIYDADEVGDVLFIAMRYVEGSDLKEVIRAEGRLDAVRTAAIVGQIASALDAAHEHGLVHRDVKPGNVLLTPDDHVYVSDFGLTKRALSVSGLTATGQLVGTIDYVAPEHIKGDVVDGRADVYSLGCVVVECLTGHVPYLRDLEVGVLWGPRRGAAADGDHRASGSAGRGGRRRRVGDGEGPKRSHGNRWRGRFCAALGAATRAADGGGADATDQATGAGETSPAMARGRGRCAGGAGRGCRRSPCRWR